MYDVPDALSELNIESWQRIVLFYEDLLTHRGFESSRPLLELVREVSRSKTASAFRAGQSMATLIISTKQHHGLDEDDPFVALSSLPEDLEIEYVGPSGRVVAREVATPAAARHVLEEC